MRTFMDLNKKKSVPPLSVRFSRSVSLARPDGIPLVRHSPFMAQRLTAICKMCKVSFPVHPTSERVHRHDNIAYLINLSSIHVSTAVYANIVKHSNI